MEDIVKTICQNIPSPSSRAILCDRCKGLLSTEDKLEELTEDSIPALCQFSELDLHCSLCEVFRQVSLASNPGCDDGSISGHRLRVLLNTDMKDSESGDQVLSDVGMPLGIMIECKVAGDDSYGGITALDFLANASECNIGISVGATHNTYDVQESLTQVQDKTSKGFLGGQSEQHEGAFF